MVPDANPVIPGVVGAPQAYVVLAGTISVPFEGETEKLPAEQIVAVLFAITGVGSTVTMMSKFEPTQEPAAPDVGVTVYVTVVVVLIELVSVCEILLEAVV